jgi:hypothetical protein
MTPLLMGWFFGTIRRGRPGHHLYCTTKKFREAKMNADRRRWFTRFVPFERFLHFLVVTSFLLLVITGMPCVLLYELGKGSVFIIGAGNGAHVASHGGDVSTSACMWLRSLPNLERPRQLARSRQRQVKIGRLWGAAGPTR